MPVAVLKHPFLVVYRIVLKGFLRKGGKGDSFPYSDNLLTFFPTESLPTFDERDTTMIPDIPEKTKATFGNCYFINSCFIFHFLLRI